MFCMLTFVNTGNVYSLDMVWYFRIFKSIFFDTPLICIHPCIYRSKEKCVAELGQWIKSRLQKLRFIRSRGVNSNSNTVTTLISFHWFSAFDRVFHADIFSFVSKIGMYRLLYRYWFTHFKMKSEQEMLYCHYTYK